MQIEDRYEERTSDLVAKVRALREAAEREMNCFTCQADYEVRRVVGRKAKASPVADATSAPEVPSAKMPAVAPISRTPPVVAEGNAAAEEDL